jgi:hypothetical protein
MMETGMIMVITVVNGMIITRVHTMGITRAHPDLGGLAVILDLMITMVLILAPTLAPTLELILELILDLGVLPALLDLPDPLTPTALLDLGVLPNILTPTALLVLPDLLLVRRALSSSPCFLSSSHFAEVAAVAVTAVTRRIASVTRLIAAAAAAAVTRRMIRTATTNGLVSSGATGGLGCGIHKTATNTVRSTPWTRNWKWTP